MAIASSGMTTGRPGWSTHTASVGSSVDPSVSSPPAIRLDQMIIEPASNVNVCPSGLMTVNDTGLARASEA